MKSKTRLCLILLSFSFSCSDKDTESPNRNNNIGGVNSGCGAGPSIVTDIDGNIYNVVTIGNQCWMKTNLKTTRYRNGDSIPGNLNDTIWGSGIGAQADYNGDTALTSEYGKLYNFYAVSDLRGLCPIGWHVPSDAEWNYLAKTLDYAADTTCISCIQSTVVGGMMKDTGSAFWQPPNLDATNVTGFTALPGGFRTGGDPSNYFYLSTAGFWWTSRAVTSNSAWTRGIYYDNGYFRRLEADRLNGFSVRCIKD
jgi:uncharacterized protein (TIGR02145 family)